MRVKERLIFIYCLILTALLLIPRLKYSFTLVRITEISIPFIAFLFITRFKLVKQYAVIFVCVLITVLIRYFWNTPGRVSASINTGLLLYLMVLPFFVYQMLLCFSNEREKYLFCLSLIAMIIYVAITTFKQIGNDETVARLLAHGTLEDDYINEMRSSNVGGYGFSYCVGFFCPYLASLTLKTSKKVKSFLIFLMLIIFVFIVKTQYMTLLLLSVVFTTLVYLNSVKNRILRISLTSIAVILLLTWKQIYLFFAETIHLQILSDHFYDLYGIVSQGMTSTQRSYWFLENLKLFINNPILGANLLDPDALFTVNHSHSMFLGLLAGGGIVGVFVFYFALFKVVGFIRNINHIFDNLKFVYLMYFILSLFNPINSLEISCVVFLLIPLIDLLLSKPMAEIPIRNVPMMEAPASETAYYE